jgi:hypothetical protein
MPNNDVFGWLYAGLWAFTAKQSVKCVAMASQQTGLMALRSLPSKYFILYSFLYLFFFFLYMFTVCKITNNKIKNQKKNLFFINTCGTFFDTCQPAAETRHFSPLKKTGCF